VQNVIANTKKTNEETKVLKDTSGSLLGKNWDAIKKEITRLFTGSSDLVKDQIDKKTLRQLAKKQKSRTKKKNKLATPNPYPRDRVQKQKLKSSETYKTYMKKTPKQKQKYLDYLMKKTLKQKKPKYKDVIIGYTK
jgi:hypothetical protein